jgi:subtilisin family serine protease
MRRAVLAILLCAAPLVAAPAHASPSLLGRQALREALGQQASAASTGGVRALPLDEAPGRPSLAEVASARGPVRVLVGVRSRESLDDVARVLSSLGARPERFPEIGVLAATAPDGAALARALSGDERVTYVERDAKLSVAADPLDNVDPLTGIKYTWAYDAVRAGDALLAAGGGSRRSIAVVDTGLDISHPEFAGRVARTYDTFTKSSNVTDTVGHGTFVTGLIAAVDGNGIGGKGVAGNTKVFAIRASRDGDFTTRDLLRGIRVAIRRGADVLNLSLAGGRSPDTGTLARALAFAWFNDVLPVAASGNTGANGNDAQYPAAVLGGGRGASGIGLSVAATDPNGRPARFSTHNRFVSLAAPGANDDCTTGVLSTLPAFTRTEWDVVPPGSCPSRIVASPGGRFAYGQGTSFAAPIVSGLAALAWQVEPRLASEQVAEVLIRSARQTRGRGWNQYTGAGVVDGAAATALARTYDVTSPRARGRARRAGDGIVVRATRVKDRTEGGRELAGHVRYGLLVSRDGGRSFDVVVSGRRRAFKRSLRLRGTRPNVVAVSACDGNGNCGVRRLGRYRP